jgi:hypothetical protein
MLLLDAPQAIHFFFDLLSHPRDLFVNELLELLEAHPVQAFKLLALVLLVVVNVAGEDCQLATDAVLEFLRDLLLDLRS